MPLQIDLGGQVALVTGGTRGVGRGIAGVLAEAGALVVVCGRNRPAEEAGAVEVRTADVRDPEAAISLVEGVVADHGRLDVVVNNAGGSPMADTATASTRFSEQVIALNLLSALRVSQAANRVMQDQDGGGVIINVSSLSGLRPSPGTAAYGAAKAGLVNLTETLAMEWAPKVRVNCVSPGVVRTEELEAYYGGPDGAAAVAATVPMGRVAEPADVGHAVAWLASPLAGFVSGANVVVHGGGERLAFTEHLGSR